MRNLFRVVLLSSLIVAVGEQAHVSNGKTNAAVKPANQTLDFLCPAAVNVGVTNRPAEWISYDQKIPFQRAHIGSDSKGAAITCEYAGDVVLMRFVPGYKCQAYSPTSRSVSCSPKPKTPIKIKP